jgi:transposase
MGNQKPKKTKRVYSPEYKADAVKLWRESGEPVLVIAKRLGISDSALGKWIQQDAVDRGERDGTTTADRTRIAELEKELKQTKMERDFLKKAAVFFAKETE